MGALLNYCETLLPDQPVDNMSEQARSSLVKVLQWTQDPELAESNNIIILSTEHLSMVPQTVLGIKSSRFAQCLIAFYRSRSSVR